MNSISRRIAEELGVREQQVNATVELLDEGATVPFIARYRKEITGSLDDSQLRNLEERLRYLRELEDRRATILKSIEEQGKLTDELKATIQDADTKNRLEDLYLPYKPKRRTKAQIAREAGLEPLADALYDDPTLDPETTAQGYLNKEAGVEDTKAALDGARYILMERFAEDAELLGSLIGYEALVEEPAQEWIAGALGPLGALVPDGAGTGFGDTRTCSHLRACAQPTSCGGRRPWTSSVIETGSPSLSGACTQTTTQSQC